MKIKEKFKHDQSVSFEFNDVDTFFGLDPALCKQSYGICFCDGKLVIVFGHFGGADDEWGFPGGRIEKGETYEEALKREIKEESNMEIISCLPIGYQKCSRIGEDTFSYQLRYACKVRPYEEFVADPAGGVIKAVKLVNPVEYRKYVTNWGKIGDYCVKRAWELIQKMP